MPVTSSSGFHRAVEAAGGKKGILSHAASGGGSVVATLLLVHQLWGGDIERAKSAQVDSTVARETVQAVRTDVADIKEALWKLMLAQGVKPPVEKQVDSVPPETVFVPVVVEDTVSADTT